MDDYEHAKRIAELLRADLGRGSLAPLSEYLRRYPGHDELTAREYAAVAGSGASPSDSIALDWLTEKHRHHYVKLGEIARGGMGAILQVRDETLKRELAMKVVLGEGGKIDSSRPEAHSPLARRFLEEAQITSRLDHPGVVPVHELGADQEGRLFFTMKLIRNGKTLQDVFRLAGEGNPEYERSRIVQIFVRVLETLAYAHEKGIVHRDLKPPNIMVGDFGEVYVMDWGLAKVLSGREEAALSSDRPPAGPIGSPITEVGQILGTPAYMPIEQARNEDLDERADIYAVGAMLYEYVSGAHPYGERGITKPGAEVILRLLKGPPEPLADFAPDAPAELVSVAEKAMAREREDRYATAMDFARDLRNFVEGRVVLAHETGTWAELRKWIARNRPLAGSFAAALLLLVAGLFTAISLGIRADRERGKADLERVIARHLAYRANIGAAIADLANLDLHAASLRLEQAPADLRGWEWRYLASRLDESFLSLKGRGMALVGPSRLRVVDREGVVRELDLAAGTTRTLRSIPQTGSHAWVTKDGEFVCLVRPAETRRNGYEVLFVPLDERSETRIASLDIRDYRWDVSFRMPRFAYCGADDRMHVLDVATGEDWTSPRLGVLGPLRSAGQSWRGRYFLITPDDLPGETALYDLVEDRILLQVRRPLDTEPTCLALNPTEDRVVLGTIDGALELWDLSTHGPAGFRRVQAHRGAVQFVAVHPDGQTVASGGLDRAVKLHDLSTGALRQTLLGHLRSLEEGHFTPDGEILVTRDSGSAVRVWRLSGGDPCVLRGHEAYVYAVAFSPDGSRIYSGGWDGFFGRSGALKIWDAATGHLVASLGEEGMFVLALQVTRDGGRIATVGGVAGEPTGGPLRVWDAATGRLWREHPGGFRTLGLHPDGVRAIVADFQPDEEERGGLQVLDLDTGEVLVTLLRKPMEWAAFCVDTACSPDGRFLATPDGRAEAVILWDAQTYREIRRIELPGAVLTSLAFSPDSSRLLATASDDLWRVWEVDTGREIAVQAGTGNEVLAGAFTPDGRSIVTGGRDRNLRLWDARTVEEIVRLPGHSDYIKAVAVSPDGQVFATASGDKTVRLWHTRTAQEIHQARIRRARLVAEVSPRVDALFSGLGDPQRVVETLREELAGPPLTVALQIALAKAVRQEGEESGR